MSEHGDDWKSWTMLPAQGVLFEPDVVLAVVGSTRFADPDGLTRAREIIEHAIRELSPVRIVSGAALGIDSLGAQIAREHGLALTEYPPANQRWEPSGFKERNLLIAADCTHLLRITCHTSRTYGSGWTAERAAERGAKVLHRVL